MKKIMKRIGILIGWLVWTAGASAQSWSLDDCMKYAVEHATEVKREDTFRIVHIMTDNPLTGISDIGIRLRKPENQ